MIISVFVFCFSRCPTYVHATNRTVLKCRSYTLFRKNLLDDAQLSFAFIGAYFPPDVDLNISININKDLAKLLIILCDL